MLRDYRVRGWFWWTAIAACGCSFVLGLDSATASERAPNSAATGVSPSPVRAARPRAHATSTVMVRAEDVPASMAPSMAASIALPSQPPVLGEPTARGLRRLAASEVSAEMLVIARRIIREHHHARPGTEVEFEYEGQDYVARIERHYHPEGGPVKPWGYHPGVSLLTAR